MKESIDGKVASTEEYITDIDVSQHSSFHFSIANANNSNYSAFLQNYMHISYHSTANSNKEVPNSGALLASYVNMKQSCHGTKSLLQSAEFTEGGFDQSSRVIFDNVLARLIGFKERMRLLKTIFDEVDEDGDGFINRDEFLSAFKNLDLSHYTDEQVYDMFDHMDVDGKEKLSFVEFSQLEKMPTERKMRLLQNPKKTIITDGLAQMRVSKCFTYLVIGIAQVV